MTALPSWLELLVSASEISSYRECPRRWAWGYIEGIRGPQHPAAALGTEVDDEQIQPYLRDGRGFDFSRPSGSGEIAASMLAYLPKPRTVEIQKKILMPSPTWIGVTGGTQHVGFGYLGFSDIFAHDSALFPGLPGGVPGVGDTKTTSDIGKWAKTEKQLRTDVQAMLYATYAMYETGARSIDLAWIYGQTGKTRKAKLVQLRVESDHVAEQFSKINDTALEMLTTRRAMLANDASSPLDLPPEPDQCEAYGGCPYRDRCNLSPGQIIEAHAAKATRLQQYREDNATKGSTDMANSTADMLAGLRARAAAKAAAPAPAAPPPPPPPAPPVAPSPPPAAETMQDRLGTAGYVPPSSGLYERPLPPVAPAPSAGINPPESLLPPAPPVGTAPPAAAAKRAPAKAATTTDSGTPQTVRVVWGEEVTSPIQYNSFRVGPFEATGVVQPGETIGQAVARVYAELEAFAEESRNRKAISFRTTFK